MAIGFSTLNHSTMFGLPNRLDDQVRAAAAAGFDSVALDIFSLRATVAAGGLPDLAALVENLGLDVLDVCALALDSDPDTFEREVAELVEIGHRLHPRFVMVRFADLGGAAVERARRVAGSLQAVGSTLVVEPSPVGTVSSLALARDVLRDAGIDGFRMVLDTWHVFAGGWSWADVAAVVPDLAYVQIADGTSPAGHDAVDQTMHHRRQPADGDFDLARLIAVLADRGYDGPWCTEVLDERARALPVEEFAATSYRELVALLGRGSVVA